MTIALSANTPRVSYTVNEGASQTSFTVPFVFFTASTDLNVFVDNTARTFDASTSNTSQYTVSGGNGSTGSITTTVTGASGGSTVVITRAVPLSRTTDFPSSGAFEVSKLNTELDTITAIQSDFNDDASRAIRLQDSDSAVSMELPLLASRKGTVLGFNASTGAAEAGPTIANVNSLSAITANINTVAGISSNVTTVAGISSNVTTVAGIASNVSTLAASDVVADMALLANSDVIADMALLATTDVIADMALLATSDVISDMNTLATSDIVSDLNTLATSDIVSDLNTLATSDIVSDINTLATSDIVSDLNTLATSDIVTDLNLLATSANVTNMATLGASGVVSNIATVAGVASNVTTVASNISGVNSFAERYRVASSDPSSNNDEGDLVYNTTDNALKFFNGSSFQTIQSFVTGISSGNVPVFTSGVADDDFLRVNGTSIEGRSASEVLSDIGASAVAGSSSIVTTGALNSGSITSGFGNIDIGSSTITTTGAISGGSLVIDNITIDGTEIDLSSGDITLDAAGDISLDADGGNIKLLDGGTQFADIYLSSNSFHIYNPISDGDIILQGNDGGSAITALTLDMSDAGKATFNNAILVADGTSSLPSFGFSGDSNTGLFRAGGDAIGFSTGGSERARVDNNGTLLIGKTSTANSAAAGDIQGAGAGAVNYELRSDSAGIQFGTTSGHYLAFRANNSERVRLDTDGRFMFRTTTTTVAASNGTGVVIGDNSAGSSYAGVIQASASGNSSLFLNRGSDDGSIATFKQAGTDEGSISVSGSNVAYNTFTGTHWSRLTDNSKPTILKGTIIETIDEMCDWYQAEFTTQEEEKYEEDVLYTEEDSLPDGKNIGDVKYAKGDVKTEKIITKDNIALPSGKSDGDTISHTFNGVTYDDAVVKKEADNKHTKCKISDTEDSKRVYGVYHAWDNDDETVNDMYVAAVGTHVVRINKDETISAGDLLVSNGDGTAKVQDDDIIRSKTIGKVLTNIKQETYSDGSYTVPCALYCG